MERRTIVIDLETAKKWYEGRDSSLKALALTVYTKEELDTENYGNIFCRVCSESTIEQYNIEMLSEQWSHCVALQKLQIIAKYFNGKWIKTVHNIGYFLAYRRDSDSLTVMSHDSVKYPGIVYFQYEKHAKKALEILKPWTKDL